MSTHLADDTVYLVANYALTHGKQQASNKYNLKLESVERYIRESKQRNLIDEDSEFIDKKPNILLLDIETAPTKTAVWGLWKQNVNIQQIHNPWFMLTWSAKWLFDSDMYSDRLTGEEALKQDDGRISKAMWEFIDYADIVIAHNGEGFDLPRLNTRFLINGLMPPSPYQSIDTLKVARKHFAFESNKLDYLARSLGIPGKIDDGGYQTWDDIIWKGDEDALQRMETYNQNDVVVLEEVYVKLRPWIKSHPNLSLHYDDIKERCPNCGSTNLLTDDNKHYVTPMNRYTAIRCGDCGAVGRSRVSELTSIQRSHLISTTAR